MIKWLQSLVWTLRGLCDNCGGNIQDLAERKSACIKCGKAFG